MTEGGGWRDESLTATLRDGMHSMAQPLTRLQARLYLALTNEGTNEGTRELLVEAGADLDRLCLLFALTRQVLSLDSTAARSSGEALAGVLDPLPMDAEAILAGTDLTLELRVERSLPAVRMDRGRTREALSDMLRLARAAGRPGSAVLCPVTVQGEWVEIAMEAQGAEAVVLDETARLRLALARANVESQGGCFCYSAAPFRVALRLPRAETETGARGAGKVEGGLGAPDPIAPER
ncbi:MAG TPA: hypothetical protein VGD62_03445 [Acidobacteriaceae bacterium]